MSAATRPPVAGANLDAAAIARLSAYLGDRLGGLPGPLLAKRFEGGQSNPTYLLQAGDRRYVMRSKPAPAAQLLPSAHAIEREFRLQSALRDSQVPVARMHCLCEDESVIGRAFYLMDFVDGRIFWDPSLPGMSTAERDALYDELNRVIAALHTADVEALGLSDYGKPGNYFERQMARWTRQYRASETVRIEAMERLIDWLPGHIPADSGSIVSLVHGDYRLDNVIFHPSEPRILAVIDWELSTLGHPFADFAYHLMTWHLAPTPFRGTAGLDLDALGIPDEASYVRTYEARTGRTVTGDWNYYLAYNVFRLAAIMQGIVKRAGEGVASSPQAMAYARQVEPLAELGCRFADRVGAR